MIGRACSWLARRLAEVLVLALWRSAARERERAMAEAEARRRP